MKKTTIIPIFIIMIFQLLWNIRIESKIQHQDKLNEALKDITITLIEYDDEMYSALERADSAVWLLTQNALQ